jgi:hypothetical protein
MSIIRRIDTDADARLCKLEFINYLKPDEPYSKMMKRNKLNESSRIRGRGKSIEQQQQ